MCISVSRLSGSGAGFASGGAPLPLSMLKAIGDTLRSMTKRKISRDFTLPPPFGLDAMAGVQAGIWLPGVFAVGWTDVSTIFYVDDTGVMVNNASPILGRPFPWARSFGRL